MIKDWQKKLEEDLDKWLETEEHRYSCASYNEGQYCCLDSVPKDSLNKGLGRKFVIEWIKQHLDK